MTNQGIENARIKDDIITKKGILHSEDTQIKVREKTNRNVYNKDQRTKMGETRNEENIKVSDSVTSFIDVPGQENIDSHNFTAKTLTDTPNPSSEQVSGKSIVTSNSMSTFLKDNNEKRSLKTISSLHH